MTLTSQFRKLIAKIQKEIDYPKVFRATCHMPIKVMPLGLEMAAKVIDWPKPKARVQTLQVLFPVECHLAGIENPKVFHSTPLEAMEAHAHWIPCNFQAAFRVHRPMAQIQAPIAHAIPIQPLSVRVQHPAVQFPQRPPTRVFGLRPARTHSNLPIACKLPIMLRIQPMGDLPKRLVIRYRAAVLKLLQVSPRDVSFVGVCFGVPKVPLAFQGYRRKDADLYALANFDGEPDIFLPRHIWVILERTADGSLLRVPVIEE